MDAPVPTRRRRRRRLRALARPAERAQHFAPLLLPALTKKRQKLAQQQWSLIATGAPPEEIDVTAQGKIVDAWEKQPVLLDRDTMMKLPPELRPAPAPAPA